MVIRTRFDIFQNVGIIPIDNHPATVESIIIDGKNIYYDVSYWIGKELKNCRMNEFELSENINEVV